ncbi:MAG: hypothetical protein HY551_04055 [Elusimicrobia bacterium]|nr:hypothetical protein [Elusimicrobiota bacterium]
MVTDDKNAELLSPMLIWATIIFQILAAIELLIIAGVPLLALWEFASDEPFLGGLGGVILGLFMLWCCYGVYVSTSRLVKRQIRSQRELYLRLVLALLSVIMESALIFYGRQAYHAYQFILFGGIASAGY